MFFKLIILTLVFYSFSISLQASESIVTIPSDKKYNGGYLIYEN